MLNYKRIFWLVVTIALLLFCYVLFINYLDSISFGNHSFQIGNSGGSQHIGVADSVSIRVTRPYLFGLIRLPVYIGGFNFANIHRLFFWGLLLMIFIWVRNSMAPTQKNNGGGLEFY